MTVRWPVVIIGAAATLLLSVGSLVLIGISSGGIGSPAGGSVVNCAPPSLTGQVVHLTAMNMGRGNVNGMMGGAGAMSLRADRSTVSSGKVSFLVTNVGTVSHELIVLPLTGSALAGSRAIGGDSRVDESTSLGEASASCAEGSGEGILPGASGWVTLTLAPGRYELLCNLPGHYAAGMYTQLTVR
ncbi:plastocyanin/azurin family copper-binding protein [Lysinimonas soli]|uniref:Plastocyanin/azurin family copper-binding protein n=1 Tax=Lysinimonas soli TaxID=1074233 RepID=A0ABW0NVH6_9MICO